MHPKLKWTCPKLGRFQSTTWTELNQQIPTPKKNRNHTQLCDPHPTPLFWTHPCRSTVLRDPQVAQKIESLEGPTHRHGVKAKGQRPQNCYEVWWRKQISWAQPSMGGLWVDVHRIRPTLWAFWFLRSDARPLLDLRTVLMQIHEALASCFC
jgi:hypothetical protein